eukprot:6213516-Pleurochrysis_carterae.AAC.2
MHLSFAHLRELTVRHGMSSRVDDEILKRDNRTTGRIRQNMIFWGGSSDPAEKDQSKHVMKPVLDADGAETGEYREVVVKRTRNPGLSEQFTRLLLGRKLLRMKCKQNEQSDFLAPCALLRRRRAQMREHWSWPTMMTSWRLTRDFSFTFVWFDVACVRALLSASYSALT